MEKQLKAILSSDTELSLIVGNKISPIQRDSFPSISYEKASYSEDTDIHGVTMGVCRSRFLITARSTSYEEAKKMATLIHRTLSGKSGLFDGVQIFLTEFIDENQNQILEPDIVEISLEYQFHHTSANKSPK